MYPHCTQNTTPYQAAQSRPEPRCPVCWCRSHVWLQHRFVPSRAISSRTTMSRLFQSQPCLAAASLCTKPSNIAAGLPCFASVQAISPARSGFCRPPLCCMRCEHQPNFRDKSFQFWCQNHWKSSRNSPFYSLFIAEIAHFAAKSRWNRCEITGCF